MKSKWVFQIWKLIETLAIVTLGIFISEFLFYTRDPVSSVVDWGVLHTARRSIARPKREEIKTYLGNKKKHTITWTD